jgi:hypothetical protein
MCMMKIMPSAARASATTARSTGICAALVGWRTCLHAARSRGTPTLPALELTRLPSEKGKLSGETTHLEHGYLFSPAYKNGYSFGGIGFFNKEDSTRKGGTVQVRTSERIVRAQ